MSTSDALILAVLLLALGCWFVSDSVWFLLGVKHGNPHHWPIAEGVVVQHRLARVEQPEDEGYHTADVDVLVRIGDATQQRYAWVRPFELKRMRMDRHKDERSLFYWTFTRLVMAQARRLVPVGAQVAIRVRATTHRRPINKGRKARRMVRACALGEEGGNWYLALCYHVVVLCVVVPLMCLGLYFLDGLSWRLFPALFN